MTLIGERSIKRLSQMFLMFAIAGGILGPRSLLAQTQESPAVARDNSFDTARPNRSFHFGGFFTGGFVPNYWVRSSTLRRSVELNFYNAGVSAGWIFGSARGPGPLRGRAELGAEFLPFWLADYPKQTQSYCVVGFDCFKINWGPYRRYGMSVTPFLLRWNFTGNGRRRALAFAQLGGGLLWTDHKFPLLGGSTSVINFTPQLGAGESLFVRKNQSLDFAVKAVHISNAGLGDNNPGLNVTLQFGVGYSWWK